MREDETSEALLERRQAGVCMHISSLPGPYGIGEIGAPARAFVDKLHAMEITVWPPDSGQRPIIAGVSSGVIRSTPT